MRLGLRHYTFEQAVLIPTNPMAGLDEGNELDHGNAECYAVSSS